MEQIKREFVGLNTTMDGIHTILKQQIEDRDKMKEEMKLKFTEVCEKLESAKEDIRMLQNSSDELVRTVVGTMELASTEQGESSVNPCIKQAEKSSPSGFYWTHNTIGHPVPVYCDMGRTCCGESGAWMRVAHINMTDSTHSCPYGFSVVNTVPRRCSNAWCFKWL